MSTVPAGTATASRCPAASGTAVTAPRIAYRTGTRTTPSAEGVILAPAGRSRTTTTSAAMARRRG